MKDIEQMLREFDERTEAERPYDSGPWTRADLTIAAIVVGFIVAEIMGVFQ